MFERSHGHRFWVAVFVAAVAAPVFADSPAKTETPSAGAAVSTTASAESMKRSDDIVHDFESGHVRDAQRAWEAWSKVDKKSPWPWVTAARLAFGQKRYKKVVSYSQAALDRSPGLSEAFYWKGKGLEAEGNNLEAANEYRAATLAKPAYPQAREALTRLASQLGFDANANAVNDPLRSQ